MNEEIYKALNKFKSTLIRAWTLDAEDNLTDKNRKSTREAHALADAAEKEFRDLLRSLMNAPR